MQIPAITEADLAKFPINLTFLDLAQVLNFSLPQLRRVIKSRRGPPYFRLGEGKRSEFRFPRPGVAAWIAAECEASLSAGE
jgi:predicted DNA-binding transcriptional regulator AlpA